MTGYTLHITHPGADTTQHLEDLDDLAERVALEQLAHELNPLDPTGYVVAFTVTAVAAAHDVTTGGHVVADGHFGVRATAHVAAPVENRTS